jgi:RNA recognition motif-containing protein
MATIYVAAANVGESVLEKELEEEFDRFGRICRVWVARKPSGFAFVEFEDVRDAEDAVDAMDGK